MIVQTRPRRVIEETRCEEDTGKIEEHGNDETSVADLHEVPALQDSSEQEKHQSHQAENERRAQK